MYYFRRFPMKTGNDLVPSVKQVRRVEPVARPPGQQRCTSVSGLASRMVSLQLPLTSRNSNIYFVAIPN